MPVPTNRDVSEKNSEPQIDPNRGRTYPKPQPDEIVRPTIGRIVYVYDELAMQPPCAALVADVNELAINCTVSDHQGVTHARQGVPHVSQFIKGHHFLYWDWMPFQKGQAAKTEELEAKLKEATGYVAPGTDPA